MQNCTLPFGPHQGLSEQIPKLRPDVPVSPGLILAKSLATPRCPDAPGAYSDKISCYAPPSQYRRAYSGKISCYAPPSRYRQGLFWQNLLLRPAVPISPGLILTKSLATPRCYDLPGAYFNKISCYAPPFRSPRGLF